MSREGGVLTSRPWRVHFRGGAPIEVIVDGELRCGHAELVEESDEVARIYSNIIEHYGRSGVGSLEETTTARGLPGVAEEVGARAGVFLDRPEREEELGDYEGLPESGEAFIYVAMSRLKARRMARS